MPYNSIATRATPGTGPLIPEEVSREIVKSVEEKSAAMRLMPKAQREAMYEIYAFCRKVDDIADSPGARDQRVDQLKLWRADIDAIYSGSAVTRRAAWASDSLRSKRARISSCG